jgi:hypothetical protein
MSEISETEIKAMTKEQNYIRGYKDGKSDVLDKIRAEIEDTGAYEQEVNGKTEFLKGINYCLGVIDKYKAESEE